MTQIVNITEDELNALRETRNANEWNAVCSAIKKARGGQYPGDWWPKVMVSGLCDQVSSKWADPNEGKLRVEDISPEDLGRGFVQRR